MRKLVLAIVLTIGISASISQSQAQLQNQAQTQSQSQSGEARTSILRGTVTDPSGALVPNAEVVLQPAGSSTPAQTTQTAQTSREGRYEIANVLPGAYTVRVTASGFAVFESKPIRIAAGRIQNLDVHMELETQQFQMDVSGNNNTDDTDPNRNGDSIDLKGKAIDDLPTDPTMLQQQLTALSGGDAPSIYVDGFSNGTLPPKNTIREIRINQNPYSARNDTDPVNGMIEIFTKPGTDKLHDDLFIFGNDSGFNTQDPFTKDQPSYYSTQFQGDLNGPINKKASYFLNFGRSSNQTNAVVNAEILDSSFNEVPFTQALPSPSANTSFGARVHFQAAERSTVSLHYNYSNAQQTNGGIGQFSLASQGFNNSTDAQLLQVSNSQVIGTKVVNDTRFQYIRTRTTQTPQSTAGAILVEGAFTGGGSNSGAFHDNHDSYELQNYVEIQAGKHYISPGVRLRINRDANVSRANYNGQFLFSTLTAYQITEQGLVQGLTAAQIAAAGGGASQFSLTTGTPAVLVDVADVAAFYQDDWKVRPHFTLSYGLRYEVQNYISDKGDFAPRLAFSWAFGTRKDKPARFVLRGGTGIFYNRFAASNILQAERQNGVLQQQYVVASPTFYPNIPAVSALGPQNSPTIYRISPSFRSPYTWDNTIEIDHPLGSYGSLMFNYIYNRGVHYLVTRNINAPLPGTYNAADPTSGVRPYGGTQNIDEYESVGVARSRRFSANIQLHTKNGFFLYSYYMFRYRNGDSTGGFPSNGYNIAADYGRIPQDIRHNIILDLEAPMLPGRIHFGGFLHAASGTPFNIVVGQDLNGDSQFNDRPAFATDLTRPSVIATRFGTFDTSPIPGQTIIPFDYGQGPAQFSLNAELFRSFTFGPALPVSPAPAKAAAVPAAPPKGKPYIEREYTIFFGVESENVFNHVNLASPVGTLGSPLFGHSTSLSSSDGNGNANRVIDFILFTRF